MRKKRQDKEWAPLSIPAKTHARMKEHKRNHPLSPPLYAIADTAINEFLDAAEIVRELGK